MCILIHLPLLLLMEPPFVAPSSHAVLVKPEVLQADPEIEAQRPFADRALLLKLQRAALFGGGRFHVHISAENFSREKVPLQPSRHSRLRSNTARPRPLQLISMELPHSLSHS
ncbi:hypothetical protein cyc_02679 [Cyclospora cayetanensis]|uniref:Secreted protein n=1 Tax=Cyclospora cayetanensis TaxID=88456 RepID=A0A1D3D6S0_9EIME|nr:hypothetical protein cyc_02679 [Cyclospora cayetanensis]